MCFDAQFSCSHAEPFVGTAMILAKSEGDPQTGKQASVRIEGSETWLPALVPVHAPRGPGVAPHDNAPCACRWVPHRERKPLRAVLGGHALPLLLNIQRLIPS